jgi:hypothetical protein
MILKYIIHYHSCVEYVWTCLASIHLLQNMIDVILLCTHIYIIYIIWKRGRHERKLSLSSHFGPFIILLFLIVILLHVYLYNIPFYFTCLLNRKFTYTYIIILLTHSDSNEGGVRLVRHRCGTYIVLNRCHFII